MTEQHLHIVSFNVPWPADYGGVIDVFYRIKALHALGIKIHLHCYTYGREQAPELERYCVEVHYYKRETYIRHLLARRPYITASRCSRELLARIQKDNHPVLLEGLHNGWLLEHLDATKRIIMLRAHNVEHDYYSQLALAERRLLKRLYLKMDARKLRRYEPVMLQASHVLAISEPDALHFQQIGCQHVSLLPPSHPLDELNAPIGMGDYVLFQGNLSVAENINAARYLIEEVMAGTHLRFVVAGRDPSPQLSQLIRNYPLVTLEANPSDERMEELIRNAQINILYTDQNTGVKLKLLHALHSGRHCVANSLMVNGTHLEGACHVADTPDATRNILNDLMLRPFTEEDLEHRSKVLGTRYSNQNNAQTILNILP